MNAARLPLALGLDLLLGDPPNRYHPVAWMGSLLAALSRRARRIAWAAATPQTRPALELAAGAGVVIGGAAIVGGLGLLVSRRLERLPAPWRDLALAYLLKTSLALRGLDRAAGEVQAALEAGDLPAARRALSWHLVSRDTAQLDESQAAAAAIESVAENTCDGIIAPLFYALLGGPPAALVYRLVNTADAMFGYHTPELEWLGKAPARLDDLLNWIPARLSGLGLALAAALAQGRLAPAGAALAAMRRDARRTQSPNAGYPMSAMAGGLDVTLEKIGQYRLGQGGRSPGPADLRQARRIMRWTALIGGLCFLWLGTRCKTCRR